MNTQLPAIVWRLLRPPTLTASITPVLVGAGLAWQNHHARPELFWLTLVSAMLIQAAANMLNEYFDHRRGLDNADMVGIAGAIVRDRMQPRTVLAVAGATLGAAAALGAYIGWRTSWWVLVVGILCTVFVYLYSAGPRPISYTPFGELTAGVVMGPAIILITYYIQAGSVSSTAGLASVPIAILIGCVLLANNIRDIEHDARGGRRTLPITIGRDNAVRLLGLSIAIAYTWLIALMAGGLVTWWASLTLLFAPLARRVPRRFNTHSAPELQGAFKAVSQTLIAFGLLFFAGLIIGAIQLP